MRMTRGWTGLRTSVVALAIAAGAGVAHAGTTSTANTSVQSQLEYSTAGAIGTTGVSGPNVISFNSVPAGSFSSPSNFSLGDFTVAALPAGQSTTYTNTPFRLTYLATKVDGQAPVPNQTPIQLTGVLNGTITGAGQSSVVATFDATQPMMFQTGGMLNTLTVSDPTLHLVPSLTNGGLTTAQSQITVQEAPIPEPTSVALFLTALAGAGLRRRLGRNRGR